MNLQDYNVVFPHMTSMTREAVATVGLDPKAASKCKNMFALGICFCIYNRPLDHAVDFIRRKFAKKPGRSPRRTCWRSRADIIARPTRTRLPIPMWYGLAPLPAGLYSAASAAIRRRLGG